MVFETTYSIAAAAPPTPSSPPSSSSPAAPYGISGGWQESKSEGTAGGDMSSVKRRVWMCRGALLPWDLLPGINDAYETKGIVTFQLQTAPSSMPRMYQIDFTGVDPYQIVDMETREVLDTVSPGPVSRRNSATTTHPSHYHHHHATNKPLSEWPLRPLEDMSQGGEVEKMAALPSMPAAAGQHHHHVVASSSMTDYRDAVEDFRFGLKGSDDFELLSSSKSSEDMEDAVVRADEAASASSSSSSSSVVTDPETGRKEMLQAVLSHETNTVMLRSLGSQWDPCLPNVTKGGVPQKGVSLVRLDKGTEEYRMIESHFLGTATPRDVFEVTGVMRIQNKTAAKRFAAVRSKIWSDRLDVSDVAWEDMLWHGCSSFHDLESLLVTAFRPFYSQRPGSLNAYGKGCYFSMSSTLADQYACDAWSVEDQAPVRCQILAHVVVGDAVVGRQGDMPPLKANPSGSTGGFAVPYDSFVDSEVSPKLCVTTHDSQALQMYVVMYNRKWPEQGARVIHITTTTTRMTPHFSQPCVPSSSMPLAGSGWHFHPSKAPLHQQQVVAAAAMPQGMVQVQPWHQQQQDATTTSTVKKNPFKNQLTNKVTLPYGCSDQGFYSTTPHHPTLATQESLTSISLDHAREDLTTARQQQQQQGRRLPPTGRNVFATGPHTTTTFGAFTTTSHRENNHNNQHETGAFLHKRRAE